MKTQCLNSDIISTLPQNIMDTILSRIPIKDALRTSVLSKKWRYSWRSMPKLVFTDDMVEVSCDSDCQQLEKYKLVSAIFHVLLFHNGPTILKFTCSVYELEMDSEFAQMLNYLSMGNKVKGLIFIGDNLSYKLPTSFFSLQGLEHIYLENCTFEPPLTFNRFSRLKSIKFNYIEVSAQMLQRFLSMCPLLERISLMGYPENIDFVAARENMFTFVDLLHYVPLIRSLEISAYYMKYLSVDGMPHKLPTSLVHLRRQSLSMYVAEQNHISSALCMIRSSPLLVKIKFEMYVHEKLHIQQTPANFLDPEYYSGLKLDHLETLEIKMVMFFPLVMGFVKLIMAKSPVLKKVIIKFS